MFKTMSEYEYIYIYNGTNLIAIVINTANVMFFASWSIHMFVKCKKVRFKDHILWVKSHNMVNCQYLSVMTLCEIVQYFLSQILLCIFIFIFLWFVLIESFSFRVNGMHALL